VLSRGYSIAYEPLAEALHAHMYSLRGLARRTYLVGRTLRRIGMDGGATLGESSRFLLSELRYFIRQGHAHRVPQLLVYELMRWAGFQMGRLWPSGGERAVRRAPSGASRPAVARAAHGADDVE
jgi:hypothetical protein